MRIVAGDAAKLSLAALVATAHPHLLGLRKSLRVGPFRREHEDREELVQWQAGTEVKDVPPTAHHARYTKEMALLADSIPQRRFELSRVDDGIIKGFLHRRPRAASPHMQLARTVTALATDGVLARQWHFITIN